MAIIKKSNVVAPKKIKNKNGDEKTLWKPVGTLITFEGPNGKQSTVLELNSVPDQKYFVFEQEEKREPQQQTAPQQKNDNTDITVEDIPF